MEERCFMHEDKFVSIFERMLEQNYIDEAESLIEEEARKRKKFKKGWKNLSLINGIINFKKEAEKFKTKRFIYKNQFFQDNEIIFSKKKLEIFEKKHEIHLIATIRKFILTAKHGT
jgi:hypothetical protein